MFPRALKRTFHHDTYTQITPNIDLLTLPFLCPALFWKPKRLFTSSATVRPSSNSHSSPSRPDLIKQPAVSALSCHRSLASAAEAHTEAQHDSYIPFDRYTKYESFNSQPVYNGQGTASLTDIDPNLSPLVIVDGVTTHPAKFRVKDSVSGDLNDIHQNLSACLEVGRFERAAALLRRLNEIYKPDAPGLLVAHNNYVNELAAKIVRTRDQQLLNDLQRWFKVDLLDVGVLPNAQIYARMIQASSQTSDLKVKDMIMTYLALAKEAGIGDEVKHLVAELEGEEIFSAAFRQEMDSTAIEPSKYEAENLMEPSQITDNIPEIHPTQQKGSGLLALKKSLNMFAKSVTAGPGASLDHTKFTGHHLSAEERQSLLEKTTVSVAMERWRSEDAYLKKIGINSGLSSSSIGAMMWEWHEALVPRIEEEVKRSIKAEKMKTRNKIDAEILQLGPYLQSLPAEKISAIAILTCMNRISTESIDESGVRLHHVVLAIGESVQNETLTEKGRNKRRYINWRVSRQRNGVKKGDAPSPAMSPDKLHFGMISRMHENLEWPGSIKVSLGAMLLSHLMDIARVQVSRTDPKTEAQVQESQPVFLHAFQYWMGRRVGVVKLNSDVIEKLTRVPVSSALAKYLPMIAEPRPWTGFREGGFYDYPLPVVRISPADVQSKRYALTAAENGDMTRVFAGLDVLAKTQWKINRFVLGVMLEVWNSGEAVASIPPEHPTAQYPPEPQPSDGLKARREWVKAMREIENRRTGLKTQRCFQNFQLEVARAYLDETFYFPHNCDFRGRAYPMVPFLNHMGADNVRGLLLFAQGKELNESGLWWLKIHLANVFGYDKASFEQRVKFTDDNRSEMYDSVNNPLGGKRWWLKAEDPWQCLAVCNELKSAYDMPDPTRYVCQLPIHQDGTCNGLQHYAALGGDVAGAQQVNLEPGSRPSDIYTAVAETVKAEIADEAAQGQKLAQVLDGLVTRKVVKQTVMTNVYGVTFVGAKRQVQKQIEDILPPPTASDHQIRASVASSYIVKKIFRSLSTMFNGAHDIQYWLTESARRIAQSVSPEQVTHVEKTVKGEKAPSQFKGKRLKGAKNELTAFKSSVIWTTPLKMPVVQPYRQRIGRRIETRLQGLSIANRSPADPVLKAKQIQAFPPNFIHSLDATHMFLTALKCHEVGLTFAAIHDSFWTHAGDVNTMNRIIRDAFIRMHSEDIIGRLAAEFKVRYKGYMHLEHVISHSPIGNRLMKWRRQYYAETTRKTEEMRRCDELALETRRLRLLSSDDPTEREEGKRMVTPGSMFAEADEKARAPLEVRPATIGGMGAQSSRSKKLIANEQLEVGDLGNTETVEPILDDGAESLEADTATIDEELESAAEDMPELSGGEESGETQLWRRKKVKCRVRDRKLWLWVPLTFPPVPKKGEFDVTRLKDSQYFFS